MLQFFYNLKNKKGFTLIELIVVIAILGILATIAIPRFAGVRGTANEGVAISTLTNIQRAAEMASATLNQDIGDIDMTEIEAVLDQDVSADFDGNPTGAVYTFASGVATVTGIDVEGDLGETFSYDDIVD